MTVRELREKLSIVGPHHSFKRVVLIDEDELDPYEITNVIEEADQVRIEIRYTGDDGNEEVSK